MAGIGGVLLPLHDVSKGHLVCSLTALDYVLVGVVELLLTIVGHIGDPFWSCVCVCMCVCMSMVYVCVFVCVVCVCVVCVCVCEES